MPLTLQRGMIVADVYALNATDIERIKLLHEPLPTPEQQPVDEPDSSISDDDKPEPSVADLTDTNMGQLNPRLRAELLKMLEVFRDRGLFALDPKKVPACNGPHMELPLVDENSPPFQAKQRRYSPEEVTMIQAEIQKMVAAGIIQRSTSPWAAGLVLVRKKDGTVRMCQDYRKLNERLVSNSGGLGVITTIHSQMANSGCIT